MKTLKFMLASLLALVGFVAVTPATAAQLQAVRIDMEDSGVGVTAPETIYFRHTSAASLSRITFQWCKDASGGTDGCSATATILAAAELNAIDDDLGDVADWNITPVNNMIYLNRDSGSYDVQALDDLSVTFNRIENADLNDDCDNDGSMGDSDTCYVRIKTYSTSNNLIDEGVGSYTLVSRITVTATVDPTFTFYVTGVNAGTTHNGIQASVTTTPTTLPFGNLDVDVPKYATHALWVRTNTQGGYTVSAMMHNQMTGVYAVNNIDPFTSDWDAHTVWSGPVSTTINDNTGWIGANTDDTDVPNWSATDQVYFGGIDTTENIVMAKGSPDSGLVPNYVTYAVEVNTFQPADAYAGTIMYNALPTY